MTAKRYLALPFLIIALYSLAVRTILYFNGVFLIVLAAAMLIPMLADFYFGYDDWLSFFTCFVVTTFFGGCLILGNIGPSAPLSRRQAFLLMNSAWFTLSIFGSLPFHLSTIDMSITDSIFESISGLTTTGATVIEDLDHTPAGILLWRALLQWVGGISIILMALTVLPFLKVGGMDIFKSELTSDNKALPRTAERAKQIVLIYAFLTFLCAIGYMAADMEFFDAVTHAMTTISTGGFSNYNGSFMHYNNPALELIAVVFMLLGGIPFILFLSAAKQGSLRTIWQDSQVKVFVSLVIVTTIILTMHFYFSMGMSHLYAIRLAIFNTASIITGTGFFNTNYAVWGPFATTILLFLMVIGGCAGSTTGGIKIFRFQVLYIIVVGQLQKLVYPNSVTILRYNKHPLPEDSPMSIMGFFFIFAFSFLLIAIGLSITGLDFTASFSGAIASISNVGPGLGDVIGPMGNYESLNNSAKVMLSFGMILGRLELFIVLVMLSPHFWRQK